jgi:SAM-dependent methyltransferase
VRQAAAARITRVARPAVKIRPMDSSASSAPHRVVDVLTASELRDAEARVAVFSTGLVPGVSRILEVGPLDRPVFRKPSFNVQYVDHALADDLRAKYLNDANVREILDVDIVWDGTRALADVANGAQFDCVVASHVIEHIPDPVGWLHNISTSLRPGGVVCLVIPDKRVIFDYNRQITQVSDLVDAYVRRATLPTCGQLYDFHTRFVPVVSSEVWSGRIDYTGQVRPGNLRMEALERCVTLHETGGFQDVHCHTFTPESFIEMFTEIHELGILPFRILELVPTEVNTIEFYVRLEYIGPNEEHPKQSAADFADILARADQIPSPGPRTGADFRATSRGYEISARERRLIDHKRRVLLRVRSLAATLRRQRPWTR